MTQQPPLLLMPKLVPSSISYVGRGYGRGSGYGDG